MMRIKLLAAAMFAVALAAPGSARAARYVFTTNSSTSVVLPQIDRLTERVTYLSVDVLGTIHYDARQYGQGLDIGSYAEYASATYVAQALFSGFGVGVVSFTDASTPANTMGALNTYIDYSYDFNVDAFGENLIAGDPASDELLEYLYHSPAVFNLSLYSEEKEGRGFFSNQQVLARLDIRTTSVPEPTTWAMMLVGFGIAGFGLRRRGGAVPRMESR